MEMTYMRSTLTGTNLRFKITRIFFFLTTAVAIHEFDSLLAEKKHKAAGFWLFL